MTDTEPIVVHVKAGLPMRKPNMALRKAEHFVKVRATVLGISSIAAPIYS